jgi:hypothetical protein
MYILGIDPGQESGGWGIIDREGGFVARGENKRALEIPSVVRLDLILAAGLEEIISQRRDVGRRFAAASLLKNFGYWQGLLDGWGLRSVLVPPQKWEAKFGLIIRGAGFLKESQKRTAKKRMILERARGLFPGAGLKLVKEDGQAAALLLAYYLLTMSGEMWTIRSFSPRSSHAS